MNVENRTYRINNPARLSVQPRKIPQFKGSAVVMAEEIKPYMPSVIRGMKKVSENIGEVQNIFINALGTGLVAPIFIKWNPLSKTDEDTRTYSAWRQPVSAVLAIVTQAGITIPYNRMVNNRANSGFYGTKYNKTNFQDKEYIAKLVKKEHPYASKKVQEMIVNERMQEQKDNLLRMIRDNNIIMHTDDQKPLALADADFKKLINKVLDKQLAYETGELNRCERTIIPRKINRGEYYRTHQEEATKIFQKLSNDLDTAKDAKTVQKSVKKLIKENKSGDKELLGIFQDILDRRGNNEPELRISLRAKLDGILEEINNYSKFETKEALEQFIKNRETNDRINPIKAAINGIEECKKMIADNKKVAEIETFIDGIVQNNPKHRLFKYKFAEKIADALKNTAKNNLKAHKQIGGLIVSFLTLPVSCTLLNWCYPRFMDAVFPNLSNKKHPKEIENLVNKANSQAEVKS